MGAYYQCASFNNVRRNLCKFDFRRLSMILPYPRRRAMFHAYRRMCAAPIETLMHEEWVGDEMTTAYYCAFNI